MRIIVFLQTFLPRTETFVYEHVKALQAANQVSVVCLCRKNEAQFPFPKVTQLQFDPSHFSHRVANLLWRLDLSMDFGNRRLSAALGSVIADFQPDIIHCHFGVQAFYLIDNIKRIDIPIFITFHGYDASMLLQQSKRYRSRLKQLFLNRNIYPVFVSEALQANLRKFGITSMQGEVLYLGVDTTTFKRIAYQPKKQFKFLQVSSFVEKKGHEFTLNAFKRLLDQKPDCNANLILAGGGPLESEMKALAKRLGLEQDVVFKGWVDTHGVKELMEEASVFVHHSVTADSGDTEGLPTVLMEAMAMELPIISTIHAGIPELVTDGVNGYLVKEKDIESYANKLEEILQWDYLPINREKVCEHFAKNKQHAKLMKLYREVL